MPRSRRQKVLHVLTGVGISVTSLLLVLGIFLAFVTVAKFLRAFIDSQFDAKVISALRSTTPAPQNVQPLVTNDQSSIINSEPDIPPPPIISNQTPTPPQEELVFASFSDLFSSGAAIDSAGTTMHYDGEATAFLFAPNMEWKEDPNNQSTIINDPSHKSLVIGHQSLVISHKSLVIDDQPVSLPKGEGEIETVSADIIGNSWMVGIVRKVPPSSVEERQGAVGARGGVAYAGYVYRFDGRTFTPVFGEGGRAFESEYPGVWGFGGTEDDFLAVYGAYQGKGYRLRRNNQSSIINNYSITDVSHFFDVRIMKGGIEPGIVRIPSSLSVNWYIFNRARTNRPVFLKLFQNGTSEIVGEVNLLNTAPKSFSHFLLDHQSSMANDYLVARASNNQSSIINDYQIIDHGFKLPSSPVTITSQNLNNYDAEVRRVVKLGLREFSSGGAAIKAEVSNGNGWESVGVINNQSSVINDYYFKNPRGKELRWRLTVTPGANPEHSPFIGILDLDYEVKR